MQVRQVEAAGSDPDFVTDELGCRQTGNLETELALDDGEHAFSRNSLQSGLTKELVSYLGGMISGFGIRVCLATEKSGSCNENHGTKDVELHCSINIRSWTSCAKLFTGPHTTMLQ